MIKKSNVYAEITALYGVYDADATILGEMGYWFGARVGLRHCSLCDITHSLFREKSAWKECQTQLLNEHGIDFQAFHRNDQPDEVAQVIAGQFPAVVAKDSDGNFTLFMNDREIGDCGDSPERFMAEIIKRLSLS